MAKAVISGIGPDKPGIVAAIGSILFEHGCNIEDSTMTRLAREFAMILIISYPGNVPFETLQKAFSALDEQFGVTVLAKTIPDDLALQAEPDRNPYMISVAGHDRTGITFHVSQLLAKFQVNITDLNAQVIEGDAGPVYVMMVEVNVPPDLSVDALNREFQALAGELDVEIHLRPLEAVAL